MRGEDGDLIPVRDSGLYKQSRMDNLDSAQQKVNQQGRMVAKWPREDLEDKYLRMHEENLVLKRHARKQEDKIKRMATKLLRLVSDKKKTVPEKQSTVRDIETEEMLEELHGKLREAERQNHQLKEKLMVAKQQIGTQQSRKNVYPYVQARINTGIQKSPADPRLTKSMRVSGPTPPQKMPHSPTGMPRYGHSLLEEARAENRHLEDVIQQTNEQINIYEQDIEMLKEQMRIREAEFDEDLLKLKQQMSIGQKATIQENIDVIRLQREVKEKATKLIQLQAQYSNLEDKLHTVHGSHEQVMSEMERVKMQLMEEQNRRMAVESELKMGTTSQRTIVEFQERIQDLQRECDILKDANEKLVASAFDLEREREWRQKENALKVQVAQLEATLKSDVGEKGSILDKLSEERDNHEKLEEEHRELRINYFQIKQDYDDLKDKMKFFTKESEIDFQEIEEALMIVKQRKERKNQDLDFLYKVDEGIHRDHEKLLKELQAEHADTINELEKTRNMLITQHRINKDYQMEVEDVTRKMEDNRQEYDTRQEELAQLLDIRAVRIRKLEAQLRDVAYGTKQYKIKPAELPEEESDLDEIEDTITLERGQNLFEIHIKKISLSDEAVRLMGDEEPSVFATWEFYEFEIQSTPVIRGNRPQFDFTSQYTVKVDDFFLHYLQKDSCVLELHQSFGTDYRTMAACQLQMRDILDKSHGRLHGTTLLTGVHGEGSGINFGVVEYWIRLKVPMEQALRLYKERSKALGYIQSNLHTAGQALEAMDEDAARRPADNMNQINIKVLRCAGLVGRRDAIQPSPYCVYKFFDFPDHDTSILASSNDPEFNDHKDFPLPMTADLDRYLKSQPLQVFVFDDVDPEEAVYLGLAKIPLIPLAHDKPIHGIFELFNSHGSVTGTIEVSMKWKCSYLPPKAATQTLEQMRACPPEQPEPVHLLPGEEDALHMTAVSGAPDSHIKSRHRATRPGPAAISTPLPLKRTRNHLSPRQDVTFERSADVSMEPEHEDSVISEGTPVPGESEPVSSVSESSTSRGAHVRSSPSSIADAAARAQSQTDIEEELTAEQLIAAELGEQLNSEQEIMEDTIFTEEQNTLEASEESETDEEPIPVKEDVYADGEYIAESVRSGQTSGAETEDSEVIMASPTSRPSSAAANNLQNAADIVVVDISELSLHEKSSLLHNKHVNMLYVEYTFLGVPREETETPYSLPKPDAIKPISFNFHKVFRVDYENNYERRQYLASMLLPDDPEQGRIKFSVVSEPDDPDEDCEDVGVAYADLKEVMDSGHDMENQDIPILNPHDESEQVGTLRVTVRCLEALKAVQQEMGATDASIDI